MRFLIRKFNNDNGTNKGDKENQIHFEGYQVSNQCASLVRDGCLIPTYDAPELAYIKESSNEQFIPDVYFRVIIDNYFSAFIN